ncbi:MAG: hypothetical protein IKN50_01495 [Clostridia bacterium]|nr:hypothetical protein [Clostridia bacterium]
MTKKWKIIIIVCAAIATTLALLFVLRPLISFSRERAFERATMSYEKNKALFLQAIDKRDYSSLESVYGKKHVHVRTGMYGGVTVFVGVYGFASSSGYYGIYYQSFDYLSGARWSSCPGDEYLTPTEDGGYEYYGDDYFYIRHIEDHFYYIEVFF